MWWRQVDFQCSLVLQHWLNKLLYSYSIIHFKGNSTCFLFSCSLLNVMFFRFSLTHIPDKKDNILGFRLLSILKTFNIFGRMKCRKEHSLCFSDAVRFFVHKKLQGNTKTNNPPLISVLTFTWHLTPNDPGQFLPYRSLLKHRKFFLIIILVSTRISSSHQQWHVEIELMI